MQETTIPNAQTDTQSLRSGKPEPKSSTKDKQPTQTFKEGDKSHNSYKTSPIQQLAPPETACGKNSFPLSLNEPRKCFVQAGASKQILLLQSQQKKAVPDIKSRTACCLQSSILYGRVLEHHVHISPLAPLRNT